jgi:hypothetical protein
MSRIGRTSRRCERCHDAGLLAALLAASLWACGGDEFSSQASSPQGGQAGNSAGGAPHGGAAGSAGAPQAGAAGNAGAPHAGAAGSAGAPHAGAAGSAGAPHAGAAGSAGGQQGGAAGATVADAGCIEGQACGTPGAWGACTQQEGKLCTGTQSRSIGTCKAAVCVGSTEVKTCNLPANTTCGAPWCCGDGIPNYSGCGGKCGSKFFAKKCDGSGACDDLCDYVACWSDGCGVGTVTAIACP